MDKMLNQYRMIHRMAKMMADAKITNKSASERTGFAAGYLSEVASGKKDLNERVIKSFCENFDGVEPYMFFLEAKTRHSIEIMKAYDNAPERKKIAVMELLGVEE